MTEADWEALADALADTLSELPLEATLILVDVHDPEAGRFVRFRSGETLVIEASPHLVMPPQSRLPEGGSGALRDAGWHEPDGDRHTWWLEFNEADEFDTGFAADQIVLALRDGLGFERPDQLCYHGWEQGPSVPLVLPGLGLAHHVPDTSGQPVIHVARAADEQHDAAGRPVPPPDRLDPDERERVVDYLGTAPVVVFGWGYDDDPFDPDGGDAVPINVRSDGTWIWSESWAYFADRYGFAPEPALLAHIRSAGYRPPADLDEDTLAAVMARMRARSA